MKKYGLKGLHIFEKKIRSRTNKGCNINTEQLKMFCSQVIVK